MELGEEVGYHVGQDRMANNETDLVFVTAGVLLEELKAHGLNALTDYKVVVIDEWCVQYHFYVYLFFDICYIFVFMYTLYLSFVPHYVAVMNEVVKVISY